MHCSSHIVPPLRATLFLLACLYSAGEPRHSVAAMSLQDSHQCLLVSTPDWQSSRGVLTAFERRPGETAWRQRGPAIPVVVGKNGLAWGRGVIDVEGFPGPVKQEGDRRAPAGVFRLSSVFGYAAASKAAHIKLPYVELTPQTEAIDDPSSRYYNQVVDRSKTATPDWRSSERMRRGDNLYRWGVVVDHNRDPILPGAGSCIFLHVWSGPSSHTNGCTAMAEPALTRLIAWLDPTANPLLVQLPSAEIERLRAPWQLP